MASGSGTPQLRLALTRDPRITPTKKSIVAEEREVTAKPSINVVNLVGGVKSPSLPLSSSVAQSNKVAAKVPVCSQPTVLSQAHLFSSKSKLIPAVPKLKSDSVQSGGGFSTGLKAPLPSALLPKTSHLHQKQCEQDNVLLICPPSSGSQTKIPQLSIKSPSKILTKLPPSKEKVMPPLITGSASVGLLPKTITHPPKTITHPSKTAIYPPKQVPKQAKPDVDILPPKAKRPRTALLPLSRIKTIMKTNMQTSQPQLSQDSVMVITKATVRPSNHTRINEYGMCMYVYFRNYSSRS